MYLRTLVVSSQSEQKVARRAPRAANPPFRAHHDTEIDAEYDWTAEQEVQTSPRVFRLAKSCKDYQRLLNLLETDAEKHLARLQ
jgi:hypothetical protein